MQIKISSGVLNVEGITTVPMPPAPPVEQPPPARTPYFDVGEGTGKPGETVDIVVEAGCSHPMTGFHIAGGAAGYGNLDPVGVTLGSYLHDYLKAQGAITGEPGDEVVHYWSLFQFMTREHRPFPEEWWEYALGFFSLSQERTIPPIAIPSGTELFTLDIRIRTTTDPGEYELTCKDEHYWIQSRPRKRDLMYTNERQGFTAIETFGGKITVVP